MRSFRLALAALLLNACALQPQAPGEPDAADAVPAAASETPAAMKQTPSKAAAPPAVFEGERQEIRSRLAEQARIDRTAPVDDVVAPVSSLPPHGRTTSNVRTALELLSFATFAHTAPRAIR